MKENGIGLSSYRTMMHHEPVMLKTAQKLADLMQTDLKKMFEIQSDMRPLSPKTVLEHHRLIHLVLRQAEKELRQTEKEPGKPDGAAGFISQLFGLKNKKQDDGQQPGTPGDGRNKGRNQQGKG